MAITRYAGDRFVIGSSPDVEPTGVLDGAYLINTGNLSQKVLRNGTWTTLAGGGGGGSPGGDNTQVQFNNAGSFGGSTGLTFDGQRLYANNFQLSGILYDSNASVGEGGMVLANEGTTGVHWKNIESVLSGVGGSGVANYVARWSDEDTLTSGTIYDDGDVGIGTANPGARLHVFDSTVSDVVILETNNPNSSNGPDVIFYRNSASPADGDELGRLAFRGRNDGSQDINYANIIAEAIEVSDNIEGGALNFNTYDNGTSATRMVITGDNVGIGTTAPFRKFHVYATGDQSNENNGAFWIGDSTTNKMGLYGGVNNTNNYSYIGSVRTSQAYEDLILNPNGGKVGIVCTSPAYQLSVGNDNNGLHTDNGTDFSIGQYGSSANILALHSAGDMWLNIDSNGNDTTKKLYIAEGGLKTAASAIATFQQDGNVGIGTTAPAKLLHVEGSNPQIRLKASDATDAIINIDAGASKDAYLTFSQNGSAKWAVVHDYAGTDKLSIYNYANNANTVTFLPDGNVGIGITTPAQLLSVEGSESGAWITKLKNTHATNGNGLLVQAADNNDVKVVEFRNLAETSTFTMMGDGKVGVGSDDPRCILNVSKAYTTGYGVEDCYLMLGGQEASANSTRLIGFGYIHGTSTHPPANIGFLQNSNDDFTNGDLIFRTRETTANVSPTERMRILSDGNVGIGDNLIAPAHRLHVSGDAIISGVLYDSTNSSGVAGHVFTSEAGGPQWKMIEDVLSGVGGNGTANYVPKWEDSDTIGDSVIYDDGTSVGINTNNPGSFSAGANNLVIGSGVGDEGMTIYSATGSQGMIRFADGTSSTSPYRGRVEYDHSVDTLYLGAGGSTQFHFRSNGSLRLAETSLLEWGGDTNGIYGSNTSNYFAIRTNNVEQVRVISDGNVGIGTTAPWTRFTIAGGTTAEADDFIPMSVSPSVAGGNSAGVLFGVYPVWGYAKQGIFWERYVGNGGYGGRGKLHFVNRDAVDDSVPTIADSKMTILEDGNVGIGTTSPSTLLHIDDDTTAAGLTIKGAGPGYVNAAIVLKATNSTSYRGLGVFMHDAGGDTEWYAGTPYAAADQYMIARKASQASPDYGTAVTGNALFTVKNDGKVGIGTTTPDAELQVMNNDSSSYRFGYGGTSDVYFDADDVYFRSDNGGANQITKKGGSLGIGVVNAEHKLHVAGDAIISGYLYDSTNSTGVDGYVLTSREDGPQWDYIEDILSGVGGNGTANYVPKWEDSDTIKNSIIYDDGTNVGISTVTPSGKFHVYGGAGRFDVTNAATKDHHLTVSEGNATDWRPYAGSTTAALQLQSLEDLTGDARGILLAVKSEGNPELTTSEGLDINVNATVGTNNGTLAIKVQSDGNVGIGTNAAAALLQVETDQIIKGGIVRDGSWHRGLEITTENANYASLFFGNQQTTKYSGIVWTSSTSGNTGNKRGAQIYAHPTSATNTNLAFDTNNIVGSSSPTTKMTILGDGNVGIGITAPGYKTKIVSPSLTWGTSINDDTAALSVVKGYQDGANDSDVNVARFASVRASYGATADWAGHISLFTNSSVTDGSEGTERARITWDGNNRVYFGRSTDKVLTVQTAGGNYVGIGIDEPEHHLHVSGDAIISGVLYDSTNSTGDKGYVLTSDDNGPLWKASGDFAGLSGNLIATGTTNAAGIVTNASAIADNTSNLIATGTTNAAGIVTNASAIADNTSNLIATGNFLESEIDIVSGLIPATVIDGGGTANKVPLWSDANTIGDSVIAQSGSAIGIGTTAPTQFLDILATQESDAGIRVTLNCNLDSQAPQLVLNRAAQNGGIVDDGDVLGVIKFGGYDGNSVENSAKIEATVNGTPSNDNMPTDLSFYTASAGSPVHAMTIDKDQQIGIGTAVVGTSQKLDVVFVDDVNGAGVTFRNNDGSLQFRNVAGSANQFNPQIKGNSKHVNNVGLRLLGNAASGEDSGTTPLILLRGTVNNAKATTRPVLDIEDGDGTKLVSVAADGNVGIGTTSTSELLHAYKTADAAVAIAVENPNAGTDARARIQLMSNGGTATLTTYSAAFTTSNQNIADSALLRASSLSGGLGLSADGATPLRFWTNDTERIRVDSGGNVGVGTTTPKTLLEASGVIRSTHATSVTAGAGIEMLYNNTDGTGYLYSYDRDGSAYKTTRIGSESYFIADGNVGIATATPEHQFQVYGDALISGKFYDSTNSTGDKGYVLTSDDTGPLWAASGDFDGLSGNLITTGQTLQTQITSNDTDIAANTANLITTGQTLQTQITANDGDISTLTSNLITTGQTLQTQITANDGDISTLTSNLITTGQTLQTQITSNDTDIATNATNIATNATNIATT